MTTVENESDGRKQRTESSSLDMLITIMLDVYSLFGSDLRGTYH